MKWDSVGQGGGGGKDAEMNPLPTQNKLDCPQTSGTYPSQPEPALPSWTGECQSNKNS